MTFSFGLKTAVNEEKPLEKPQEKPLKFQFGANNPFNKK